MIQAQGYAAHSADTPLAPFSFTRREPGDDDVLIDILYSGICHSDLHQARGDWGNSMYPMVPGMRSSAASRWWARTCPGSKWAITPAWAAWWTRACIARRAA